MAGHAELSPSSAYRWLNCPGSVHVIAADSSGSSPAADEGTTAHFISEYLLTNEVSGYDKKPLEFYKRIVRDWKPEFEQYVDRDMIDNVCIYVDFAVLQRKFSFPDFFGIEERLKIADEIWGTGDAVGFDSKTNKVMVMDLKFGQRGLVEVKENPQLKLYAIGALNKFPEASSVRTIIAQPRMHHPDGRIRSCEYTADELMEWFNSTVAPAVAKAYENSNNLHINAGPWCKYCPGNNTSSNHNICPEVLEAIQRSAMIDFGGLPSDVPKTATDSKNILVTLSKEKIAKILAFEEVVLQFFKAVRSAAFETALAGEKIPGFKLVRGRKNRAWRNEEEAKQELLLFASVNDVMVTSLRSPAQIEKLLGKEIKSVVEGLLSQEEGPLKLVDLEKSGEEVIISSPEEDFSNLLI